jgi:hypothetical protein
MDMIDDGKKEVRRDKIYSLISAFYQPTFKTFYVNSTDGLNLVKPLGVFVSLGMTTSKKTLDDIRVIIENHGYSAVISEIASTKDTVSDQFLNRLTGNSNPEQYLMDVEDKVFLKNVSEANEELNKLKNLLTLDQDLSVLKDISPRVSKLVDLINKLEPDGWDSHYIQKEDNGDYKIFHRYINYKKVDDVEYRIGIFVS